jgi:hypothetical protein
MEKLTEKLKYVLEDCIDCISPIQQEVINRAIDCLATYEDTGLEPEEIELLAKQRDLYVDACGELPLKRIRELALADREKRCVVMPCQPGDKVSYKSSTGFWCNAVIKDYTPENIFITAETEIPNAEPLSHTFSILEIEAALRREQDG